jgi:hypothetical protein
MYDKVASSAISNHARHLESCKWAPNPNRAHRRAMAWRTSSAGGPGIAADVLLRVCVIL